MTFDTDRQTAGVCVHVCITCRRADEPLEPRAGARLFAELAPRAAEAGLHVVPVECLSVCKRPCTVSFAAPGKWTYVYGDLAPETVDIILSGARLYAEAPDGIIPWKARPELLKRGVIARIPPLAPAEKSPIAEVVP